MSASHPEGLQNHTQRRQHRKGHAGSGKAELAVWRVAVRALKPVRHAQRLPSGQLLHAHLPAAPAADAFGDKSGLLQLRRLIGFVLRADQILILGTHCILLYPRISSYMEDPGCFAHERFSH